MMNNVVGEMASLKTMVGQMATTLNKIASKKDKLPSQTEQAMAVHVLRSGKRVEKGVEYRENMFSLYSNNDIDDVRKRWAECFLEVM
ncbi:hypothetical protein CASFOL_000722 [Castilleja foliolosa]|uniref:Uncharacterized protein n=1 Tax=Castilleja foliolosa TaxID=1961234 RepID=A0ABD3EL17_9LAMI